MKIEAGVGYLMTEIGLLEILCDEKALLAIHFVTERRKEERENPILLTVKKQLEEYFDGKRKEFDVPVELEGTEFQKKAWLALNLIPYGKTFSYKEQAERIGNPKAVRAIGAANGKNQIPIILPCHRVVGTNGKLTGYAGGLDKKQWLLEFEERNK